MPFPNEEVTPPVTKIYLVMNEFLVQQIHFVAFCTGYKGKKILLLFLRC